MPITKYSSTDTGAPVLNGLAGSLVDVLDACLVNGYGVKDPAGWTIAYTDTNKRAYKLPPGTTEHYMAIDDTIGTYADFRGYEDMTAVDDGSTPFPSIGTTSMILKSESNNASESAWVLYTNGQLFHLFVQRAENTSYPNGSTGVTFGYSAPLIPGDNWTTVINPVISTSIHSGQLSYGARVLYFPRDVNGNIDSTQYNGEFALKDRSGNISNSTPHASNDGGTIHIGQYNITIGAEFDRIRCKNSGRYSIYGRIVSPQLPYVWSMGDSQISDDNGTVYDIITVQGSNATTHNAHLIKISGEW